MATFHWRSFWYKTLASLLLTGCVAMAVGQPQLNWDKTLGGESYEELNGQLVLPDGILVGGTSRSNLTFGSPTDFSLNILIAKLDFDGNLLWQRMYGGTQDERLWALVPTADGGFLAGGYSYSGVGGDKTQASRGDADVWLIKIDGKGNLLWDQTYGGLYRDELFSIRPLPSGTGYLLGCHSWSDIGNEKSEPSRGLQDFWVLQVDNLGNKIWDKTIGGDSYEQINDLEWAADGNVYLSGGTVSDASGDLGPEPTRGGMDFLLIKFNPVSRQVVWTHRYGGTAEDYPYALCISRTGNLFLGGRSGSAPAPPTTFNNGKDALFYGGESDYWMLELTPEGQKLREWSFGGAGLDDLYSIGEDEVGQLILGGVSGSDASGNKKTALRGGYDFWVVGLNKSQQKSWELPVGGSANDALTQVSRLRNGALVFGGHSESNAGFEKTEASAGLNDFWVVQTLCETTARISPTGLSCGLQSLTLEVQVQDCDSCCVLWSDGSMERTIEVPADQAATFSVVVYNEYGCIGRDTFIVQPAVSPMVELGPADMVIVPGSILTLGVADPALQYQWSTVAATATISVGTAGLYAVTVTDAGGCTATDQVRVRVQAAESKTAVWVPNVFSPNDDGYNDYISIFTDQSVGRVVTFQIADRWGDVCFRRDDFPPLLESDGWDGQVRGLVGAIGVYVWYAEVEYLDGTRELFEGSVTLLR